MQRISIFSETDGRRTEGFAERVDLSRGERALRATKMFGIFIAIAFLCVFIPILHFILPPLFILAACVFGATTWLEESMVTAGEIDCPNCAHHIVLTPGAESWPREERCPSCSYTLRFEKVK